MIPMKDWHEKLELDPSMEIPVSGKRYQEFYRLAGPKLAKRWGRIRGTGRSTRSMFKALCLLAEGRKIQILAGTKEAAKRMAEQVLGWCKEVEMPTEYCKVLHNSYDNGEIGYVDICDHTCFEESPW